jgi:rhodanese-related sulfurtransferase
MKHLLASCLALFMVVTFASFAAAAEEESPLVAAEKAMNKEYAASVPKEKVKTVDDLHKKWEEVIAGTSKAILLDVRTHPEFDAFHLEGSSHISSGNVYLVPKKIKDPSTEIWVFCRTDHRAKYVAGTLYKYGYKNVFLVARAPDGSDGGIVGWIKRGHPVVNYFFGYADKNGIHYAAPPLKERNCESFIRHYDNQRGESCAK